MKYICDFYQSMDDLKTNRKDFTTEFESEYCFRPGDWYMSGAWVVARVRTMVSDEYDVYLQFLPEGVK